MDEAKGRAKEAAGSLTANKDTKAEGKADRGKGTLKKKKGAPETSWVSGRDSLLARGGDAKRPPPCHPTRKLGDAVRGEAGYGPGPGRRSRRSWIPEGSDKNAQHRRAGRDPARPTAP